MMIKGSLLRSVPIVKRFGRKFPSPKWAKNLSFGGVGGEKFNPNNKTPRKSILTETRHLTQKRCRSVQRNPIKNIKNNRI